MWGVVLQKRGAFFLHSTGVRWESGEGEEGGKRERQKVIVKVQCCRTYLIIVADAADAVSVNFSARCKFLQI